MPGFSNCRVYSEGETTAVDREKTKMWHYVWLRGREDCLPRLLGDWLKFINLTSGRKTE